MALKKQYSTLVYGKSMIFTESYIQVTNIYGDKNQLICHVKVYSDNSKSYTLCEKDYQFTPSVSDNAFNFVKQSYEHLKTLDDFSGAVDVLENGQIP